ncbi:MAG: cytochrome P450 [Bryobacterales bacterium]|nr:cytochrome P450 [Bryobacterales bacterium]
MRRRCPVAFSEYRQWSLFRHEDVVRALEDPVTFSSEVSQYLSVPNGMDPPEHTAFRRIIEPYFGPAAMAAFEPVCRRISVALINELPLRDATEIISTFAEDFALRIQCAFMGWPEALNEPLRTWTRRNHQATLAADREAMAAVAMEFDSYIRDILAERRAAGDAAPDDLTARLMRERVEGRLLTDAEIVSIVRNWTVGELATIAASVGILMHYMATHQDVQRLLRAEPELLPAANDEILRIHAPLIANRRKTTAAVEIGGRCIEAGAGISLNWASANRDESVFGDPDEFRLDRDPETNLLYGKGIHVCPGAPLARLELRVVMEELLARTTAIEMVEGEIPVNAAYPASGFLSLMLLIERNG